MDNCSFHYSSSEYSVFELSLLTCGRKRGEKVRRSGGGRGGGGGGRGEVRRGEREEEVVGVGGRGTRDD